MFSMANTLTSMPSYFMSNDTTLIATCRDELVRMRTDDAKSLLFEIDIDAIDLESKAHVFADEQVDNKSNNKHFFPAKPAVKLGVDFVLMDKVDRVRSAARIAIDSLMHVDVVKAIRDRSFDSTDFDADVLTVQKDVVFNKQIGMVCFVYL